MYPDLGTSRNAERVRRSASIETMTDPNTPTAGWYDDGSGSMRYWDGSAWTEHRAPKADDAVTTNVPTENSVPSPTSSAAANQDLTYGASATATQTRTDATFAPAPGSGGTKPHVLGIIALAVAVIGFIFACIPGALIVGWVLLPIAFILSIVALFLKGKKWPAIAALAVSVVGTIVGFVVFFSVVTTSFDEAFGEIEGSSGQIETSEEGADSEEGEEPVADAPAPAPSENLAFGDTMVWQDNVEMTVSAPESFTPSEFAAGADLPQNIVFTITITNNSAENLEPLTYSRLSSGGQEGSQIFDSGNSAGEIGMSPTTVILPGQSVTWKEAWSVMDPNSLTMQIAPNWEHEDAIFTNQ